ncbi:MAG: glycosyltransferase family 39 protein [Planctomycetes bacterium]|nr:glycosyltransferase family 39 protein [Planctomycetota bacterium]
MTANRRTWLFWLALLALAGIAAALRFYKLGEWSYWSDEAFTMNDSNAFYESDPGRLPDFGLSFRVYGAWFEFARHIGWQLDERVVRTLPAIFGILGVVFTAWFGARGAGGKAALFAGVLVALAPFHLYWSQNARSYALEVACATPAGLLLGSSFISGRRVEFSMGLLFLAAAAFAHPTALVLVPGLFIFALFRGRFGGAAGRGTAWIALIVAAAAIAAILLLTPLRHAIWVHYKVKADASPGLFISTCAYYFRPTLLAAAALLTIRAWTRRDRRTLFFASIGFGALAAGFAASCVVRANAQYVLAALPFLALVVGRELMFLAWTPFPGARLAAGAMAAVLVCDFAGGAYLYYTAEQGHRARWREACAYVWSHRQPEDTIAATQGTVVECYLNPSNRLPRRVASCIYLNPYEAAKFEVIPRLGQRAWFMILDVDLDEWKSADRGRLVDFLRERCRAVAEWPLQFAGKEQTLRIWRYDP